MTDLSQVNIYKQSAPPPDSKLNTYWGALKHQLVALHKDYDHQSPPQLLSKYMRAIFRSLVDQTDFISALNTANSQPRGAYPWNEHLLREDDDMQLDLVTYFADYPTPIHDFHHLASINLVLKGSVHVQHYQSVTTPVSPHYPINKIVRKDDVTVHNSELYWLSPNHDTIQEIQAQSGRALLLRAWLYGADKVQNTNWYFPISPQNNQQFFAQRLKKLA